ncbi:MAG: hypothetical protein Q8K32_18750 [Archangium sp.]|nr:hypothetical protein [Archangium sp.]
MTLDVLFLLSLLQPFAFFGLAIFLGLIAIAFGRSNLVRALNSILVILVALLISAVDWTIEKRFVRALHGLRPGMSEENVRHIMAGFVEGTGWPTNPLIRKVDPQSSANELEIENALVFRPSAAPGDSTWGVVSVAERVA